MKKTDAGIQQQLVYVGLECLWMSIRQGQGTAGWNNPSSGSVEALAV
jgi:hypothetical protein